jgi:protein gp37
MAEETAIEWCDATFNPWWGCAKVSPACDHCYAERLARRFGVAWGVDTERRSFGDERWREPLRWDRRAARYGRRLRVFCASMADIFDTNAPEGARERLWGIIRQTPHLTWLLLTKRIGNASRMLPSDWSDGYPNVGFGITVATGPGARPMEPAWARILLAAARRAGTAFFMKQGSEVNWSRFKDFESFPVDLRVREWPQASLRSRGHLQ